MKTAITTAIVAALAGQAAAQPFVQPGDIAIGWSRFTTSPPPAAQYEETIELYSSSGVQKPDSWNQFVGVQSVEWDNTNSIPHNPLGNLIGVDFGATATGLRIYAYESGTGWSGSAMFNDPAGLGPTFSTYGLTTTRGGGLSVSPDNTRLAVAGNDSGQVYIFDYDAATRTITGAQQTQDLPTPLVTGDTSGTTWLNSTTVVALASTGNLYTVDATANPITATFQIALPGMALGGSEFTSLAHRPEVSPYIYASYSTFVSPTTTNNLYVIDPRTSPWTVVAGPIDFSTSANTLREISLAPSGELFFTTFGATLERVPDVTNPATIAANSSVDVLTETFSSSFSGLDVAGGTVTPPACYPNCDNSTVMPVLNVADFTCFLQRFAAGESYANCDGSTVAPVLNVADFTCFLQSFAAGCP